MGKIYGDQFFRHQIDFLNYNDDDGDVVIVNQMCVFN